MHTPWHKTSMQPTGSHDTETRMVSERADVLYVPKLSGRSKHYQPLHGWSRMFQAFEKALLGSSGNDTPKPAVDSNGI